MPINRTVTVGQGRYAGNTNSAIQMAVDDVAATGGGVVIVPPGTYRMEDALHLRSNVRVVGQAGAVLKTAPSVSSPIADYLGMGQCEFTVKEPDKFRVGMGVHLLDDDAGGPYNTTATIVGRDQERFYTDRRFTHDYLPRANGRAISVFSVVEATGVHDAAVEGVTLEGNYPQEKYRLNGGCAAGVFLEQSQRIVVRNVEVANYHGDAISFQHCVDIVVQDCRVHHNAGNGIHPGSGTVRYVIRGVESHHNGGCGVYYCLRTTHSCLEGCRLHDNGGPGVSIGERDTDHLIRDNRIDGNAGGGILFRQPMHHGGDRVVIQKNAIGPNGGKEARFEIVIPAGLHDVIVDGNSLTPSAKGRAARVEAGASGICFVGNTVAGVAQTREDIESARNEVSFTAPARYPPVGPAALPANGALHLGQPDLPPWSDGRPVTE